MSESKRLAKSLRRRRAAKKVLQNTPIEVIARDEGVSPKTISRDLREPATRALLAELCNEHETELRSFFKRALFVVNEGLAANTVMMSADGKPVTIGKKPLVVPDWKTRLRAVRDGDRLLRTVTVDRWWDREEELRGNPLEGLELEWDEFLVMRARRIAKPPRARG